MGHFHLFYRFAYIRASLNRILCLLGGSRSKVGELVGVVGDASSPATESRLICLIYQPTTIPQYLLFLVWTKIFAFLMKIEQENKSRLIFRHICFFDEIPKKNIKINRCNVCNMKN